VSRWSARRSWPGCSESIEGRHLDSAFRGPNVSGVYSTRTWSVIGRRLNPVGRHRARTGSIAQSCGAEPTHGRAIRAHGISCADELGGSLTSGYPGSQNRGCRTDFARDFVKYGRLFASIADKNGFAMPGYKHALWNDFERVPGRTATGKEEICQN
jgi:hypothetical protein